MKKMKCMKKEAVVLGITATGMLLAGTFAYFTDRANFMFSRDSGYVDIVLTDTSEDWSEKYLMPGQVVDLSYTVENKSETGGTGIVAKDTVVLYATDSEGQIVDVGDSVGIYKSTQEDGQGSYDGQEELEGKAKTGSGIVYNVPERELTDGSELETMNYHLVMNKNAANKYADYTFHVGVLTEAKQNTEGADWVTLATESVTLGESEVSDTEEGFSNVLDAVSTFDRGA